MEAGKLRHSVVCDRPVLNDAGEITGFAAAFKKRCSIEPLRGRELLRADQILADMDTLIIMRWSPQTEAIDATWRLRHGGTIYNIAAPPAHLNMARREIQFSCKSGLNAG